MTKTGLQSIAAVSFVDSENSQAPHSPQAAAALTRSEPLRQSLHPRRVPATESGYVHGWHVLYRWRCKEVEEGISGLGLSDSAHLATIYQHYIRSLY